MGPSTVWATTPLVPGHCVSIEPGYYREGEFGIRIESIYAVVEIPNPRPLSATPPPAQTKSKTGKPERWFGFERLTQVPIATNLVDFALMTPPEIRWLRRHNTECRDVVASALPPRPSFLARLCLPADADARTADMTLKWLRKQCNF